MGDLAQLDVVRRLLTLLNEPAAGAAELGRLVDSMPVLRARLAARVPARRSSDGSPSSMTGLSLVGNRVLEAVLFELLEDLTCLAAEQAGIPANGSMFPPMPSVPPSGGRPPSSGNR